MNIIDSRENQCIFILLVHLFTTDYLYQLQETQITPTVLCHVTLCVLLALSIIQISLPFILCVC